MYFRAKNILKSNYYHILKHPLNFFFIIIYLGHQVPNLSSESLDRIRKVPAMTRYEDPIIASGQICPSVYASGILFKDIEGNIQVVKHLVLKFSVTSHHNSHDFSLLVYKMKNIYKLLMTFFLFKERLGMQLWLRSQKI